MSRRKLPTIAICGPGECGKDTAANYIARHTKLKRAIGTSEVIAPHMAKLLGRPVDEVYAERREHRDDWATMGDLLCKQHDDPAHLVRESLRTGHIVSGIRRWKEIREVRLHRICDTLIWIERPGCREKDDTIEYGPEQADVVIENNRDVERFYEKLEAFSRLIR